MAWGCSNEPIEVRPRAFRGALDVEPPRAGRRRERRRLRNAAGVAPDDDVRGIGEGPPIQVRYRSRVAHGLRPIQFVPISKVVDEVCYRPRADEVDAERRALSEIRRQVLPHERRLGRHKNRARVVAAAEANQSQ